jgi:hypothetical protein
MKYLQHQPVWTVVIVISLVLLFILLICYLLECFSKPKKNDLPPLEFVPCAKFREKKESPHNDLVLPQNGAGSAPSPSSSKPSVSYPDYWLVWDPKTHSLRRRATLLEGEKG